MIDARAYSDDPAVVIERETWSGAELLRRAAGAGAWLDKLGATAHTPVAALLDSSANALALLIACAATRRPLAPLGTRLTPSELATAVQHLDPSVIVADAHYAGIPLGRPMLPLGPFEPADAPLPAVEADDVALILHTSATTGAPKAVAWRQGPLAARVRAYEGLLDMQPGDVQATGAPFHHSAGGGMSIVALALGAAVAPISRFGVEAFRRLEGITHVVAVPTMVEILLAAGALPATRMLHYGGAPMRAATLRRIRDELPETALLQTYGQTEGTPLACLTPEDHEREEMLTTVGRAAPGVELRIEDGEVCARAAHQFAPGEDGWLRTGDIGTLGPDGALTLVGRTHDRIVCGGENVYPTEVENVLMQHTGVRDVAVAGMPDATYGEVVAAFVVGDAGEGELRAFAAERLASFKVPTRWSFGQALPRNAAGKVLRTELITRSWDP